LRHPIKKRRWEDAPPDQDLLVELPEYTQAEVETKVSMLDKSTVMMDVGTMTGPMKGVRDVVDPVEEGVERRVYVLVKPTIIPAQVEAAGVED
jgi:phage-related protein